MTDTRRAYHPSELPEHLKEAIKDAKMTEPEPTGPNAFHRMGINTAALMEEIQRLLDIARQEPEGMGAVNWGDLGITDIEYRLSMLTPDDGPSCVVTIEEASPGCALAAWLYERLDKERFPRTYIECEW